VRGKDFVGVADLDGPSLAAVLDRAAHLKADLRARRPHPLLVGRTVALLFQKPSLRTRVSFEVGMSQLGGRALYLSPGEIKLGEREDGVDAARVLSRMVDAIVARTYLHADVETLAEHATAPVINGLSDREHPCQVLADLQTVRERAGRLEGQVLTYVGDGNNVAHSLALGCALTGAHLTIAHPEGHAPDPAIVELASSLGAAPTLTGDPREASSGAHVVYTDVWASMGQEDEAEERKRRFAPYQVNEELMSLAEEDAIFLHCLPAHRGQEVTAEVIDGPRSRVFDQAENRLHAQKALLYLLLG
jgi:ornithine carbamoyltransferase